MPARSAIRRPSSTRWPCPSWRSGAWRTNGFVRDLAAACRGDYSYLHRTLNTLDGLDFALLYYGDLFYPHYAEPGRHYLYIEGTMGATPWDWS